MQMRPYAGGVRARAHRRLGATAAAAVLVSILTGTNNHLNGQPSANRVLSATSSTYRAKLRQLKPGDTLELKPGQYPGLPVTGLNGSPDAWITISGPPDPP